MLKIWGRVNSINVQKVLWCCAELDLAYERVDAGLQFGVNDTAEYRAMNPNGLVPTIDDDGFVLWESHAIVRYLARKHGHGTLCPASETVAADADRWMEWYSTTLANDLRVVFWNLIRTPVEKRDMPAVDRSAKKLEENMRILDAQLAGRDYVAGERFSMGDIPVGVSMYRWSGLPITRPDLPNLARWYERIRGRRAFQQHCMLPLT